MLLFLVRHGIAIGREDPRCPPEAERFLTTQGLRKTREVAEGAAALGLPAGPMVSSPYVRAVQTAEIFASALGLPRREIRCTELLLPGAEPRLFFRELEKLNETEAVYGFGHAPHLDSLIAVALGIKKSVTRLKKGGMACLELSRTAPSSGELLWVATPRMLRSIRK
jgi:phosphohistidine phosphatase